MRSYPRNSPEAAARIVALVMISDGHVCRSEIEVLERLRIESELGLPSGTFATIVHTLCEDLLMGAHGRRSMMCSVSPSALEALLSEVDDPTLQEKVLGLAAAAAEADRHLADAEAQLVGAARQRWRAPTGRTPHHGASLPQPQPA